MKLVVLLVTAVLVAARAWAAGPTIAKGDRHFYLPDQAASKLVSVTTDGSPEAEVTVVTQSVAIKETGPAETVKTFGEVYTFSPETIIVHRDEPTLITFWNLQPDDEHDFALLGPDLSVLMYEKLPPLKKTSWIFTFHKEGLFDFKCMQHQPAMSGQFLVLPPAAQQ